MLDVEDPDMYTQIHLVEEMKNMYPEQRKNIYLEEKKKMYPEQRKNMYPEEMQATKITNP